LAASLNAVIDETFNTPEDADLNARSKDIVARIEKAHTVGALISALADVDQLNTVGLSRLGGTKFSVFSPSPGVSSATTPSVLSPGAKSPLDLAGAVSSILNGRESPEGGILDKALLPSSYFTFSVIEHPERLVVHWPTQFGPDFLKAASKIAKQFREEKRDPSFIDYIVSISRVLLYYLLIQLLT
jgi:hypothetical protein